MLKILLIYRTISSVAHIATILLLAVIFLHPPFSFSASQIAILVGAFALADRGTGIIWSFFMPHFSYKNSMMLSAALSALGMLGIGLYQNFWWCALMLVVTGFGLSLESLTTRLWISHISIEVERIHGFSLMHRIMNGGYILGSSVIFIWPTYEHGVFFFLIAAAIYFGALLFIQKYFSESSANAISNNRPSIQQFLNIGRSAMKYALACILILFFSIFALGQQHLLAFYFSKTASIPPYLGMALSLNPLLIVVFQGKVTKLFKVIEGERPWSPIILGFIFFASAFVAFSTIPPPFNIACLVTLLTGGEMLIVPHIDYLLSLKIPHHFRPFILALFSLTFSLGRMSSESGGIAILEYLTSTSKDVSLWWQANAIAMVLLAAGVFIFSQIKYQRKEIFYGNKNVGNY